jgi:hypothetical protein
MAMRGSRRCKGLFLAAVILFALAAPAFAAPAGSEYVPKVPKAAGAEVLRGKEGPGGTILLPEVRGNQGAPESAQSSSSGDDDPSQGAADTSSGAADTSSGGADTSSGVAETLLDPVVLLLLAGVGAAALSMTLRQGQSVPEDPDAEMAASDRGSAPATPDGEIVDREPRT